MRTIKFPSNHSVGDLLIKENSDSEKSWEEAIKAQGDVVVSEEANVSLWVANIFANDLEFCRQLDPTDLDEFTIASCNSFDGTGMENILHLTKLKKLDLWETRISNETLREVSKLPQLEHLGLDTTLITDDGLPYLSDLAFLKSLSLYWNNIDGSGLKYLHQLNLVNLDLGWTEVNDDAIVFLTEMESLLHLRIVKTKLSEDGVREIERALPNCRIQYSPTNSRIS